jgi:uncharacterized repeat protein (TIGR01451 family)
MNRVIVTAVTVMILAALVGVSVLIQSPGNQVGPSAGGSESKAATPAGAAPLHQLSPDTSRVALLTVQSDRVDVEITPTEQGPGIFQLELCKLDGSVLAKTEQPHGGKPHRLQLSAAVDPEHTEEYYLRFRSNPARAPQQASLLRLGDILETVVLGQRELIAGTSSLIHILVRDRRTMQPVCGAKLAVSVADEGQQATPVELQTDACGEAAVPLVLPDRAVPSANLMVAVRSNTAWDTVREAVRVRNDLRTLLVTDKPRYQAGQKVYMRGLTLRKSNSSALPGVEVAYEVEDARGNKVFKQVTRTDAYGISSAELVLADELNAGTWRIRARVAGEVEEKSITVGRYVLPRFKIGFVSDRAFCLPGGILKAGVQADYFFGRPVAGAKVSVRWSTAALDEPGAREVAGTTDERGHFDFEVDLATDPAAADNRRVVFDVAVSDGVGRSERLRYSVPIVRFPVLVAVVPESSSLVPGVGNKVDVITTYADGAPAACAVTWHNPPDGSPVVVQTDEAGRGTLTFVPVPAQAVELQLTARDARDRLGAAIVVLKPDDQPQGAGFLVRTDRNLYRAGDTVRVSVHSSVQTGRVYVDLLKDRQTRKSMTLELRDGSASGTFILDRHLAGTVLVSAWVLNEDGAGVRSEGRLILVEPAQPLRVTAETDRDAYLPGEDAVIRFRVTDGENQGIQAALGVAVADEAVAAHQEMRPGLEKVLLYVEQQWPSLHEGNLGLKPEEILTGSEENRNRRDAAARTFLATAKGPAPYDLYVNTFLRDRKTERFQGKLRAELHKRGAAIAAALKELSRKELWLGYPKDRVITAGKQQAWPNDEPVQLEDLVDMGLLTPEDVLDTWGHPMRLEGKWSLSRRSYMQVTLYSPGIDGKTGTADDVSVSIRIRGWEIGGFEGLGSGRGFFGSGGGGVEDEPRVRQDFPETLYFNPSAITDAEGNAVLRVPLADSITTWRMTCLASTRTGALGSTSAGLRTFQDFFVDVDMPRSLTRTDEVSVPVIVHNYLRAPQEVRLTVRQDSWFGLRTSAEQRVTVGPSQVQTVLFPIVAMACGRHEFTVIARGEKKSDAVARPVEVFPDGREIAVSASDRLKGRAGHTVAIPADALNGSARLFVKICPSAICQMIDGLDGLLRMPYGCFEQTTSVTYPNVLVLDYMKKTGKASPEVRAQAEKFIGTGYQRLVSFEVSGGGFSLYGRPPASTFLTAYGLMEFHDMSKVYPVDPALITRTQNWLAERFEPDKPADSDSPKERLRDNAYVLWALASTGYEGKQIGQGVKYLESHLDAMSDNHMLALAANALAAADPKSPALPTIVARLVAQQVERDGAVHWEAGAPTPAGSTGLAGDIETTAIAVQAIVRCRGDVATCEKAETWLVRQKDPGGAWHTTQATIQALRAILAADSGDRSDVDAEVDVAVNGKTCATLRVDASNRDVVHFLDLKDKARQGDNAVQLSLRGRGSLLYQVVGRYHMPWREMAGEAPQPLAVSVAYDRARLAPDEVVTVTATVTNNQPDVARTVMVELGLPPGFTLVPDALDQAVEDARIEKYSVTDRQVLVYLRDIAGHSAARIKYQLVARYPLRVVAPPSVAYPYYSPTIRGVAAPFRLTVER